VRRRLDYFVTHLFGEAPPPASSFKRSFDLLLAKIAANAVRPAAKVES
jgi:hypothetical protein